MPCPLQPRWTRWTSSSAISMRRRQRGCVQQAIMQSSRVTMSCWNQRWRSADLRRRCQLTSDICSSLSVDSCMRRRATPYHTLSCPASFLSDYTVVKNSPLQMFRARRVNNLCRAEVSLFCHCCDRDGIVHRITATLTPNWQRHINIWE